MISFVNDLGFFIINFQLKILKRETTQHMGKFHKFTKYEFGFKDKAVIYSETDFLTKI